LRANVKKTWAKKKKKINPAKQNWVTVQKFSVKKGDRIGLKRKSHEGNEEQYNRGERKHVRE